MEAAKGPRGDRGLNCQLRVMRGGVERLPLHEFGLEGGGRGEGELHFVEVALQMVAVVGFGGGDAGYRSLIFNFFPCVVIILTC